MTDTNHSKQADTIPALDVPAGSAPTEYLRRNLIVASACGCGAAIDSAILRLLETKRPQKWLLDLLRQAETRAAILPPELAKWRDESPDSPFKPNTQGLVTPGTGLIPEEGAASRRHQ